MDTINRLCISAYVCETVGNVRKNAYLSVYYIRYSSSTVVVAIRSSDGGPQHSTVVVYPLLPSFVAAGGYFVHEPAILTYFCGLFDRGKRMDECRRYKDTRRRNVEIATNYYYHHYYTMYA